MKVLEAERVYKTPATQPSSIHGEVVGLQLDYSRWRGWWVMAKCWKILERATRFELATLSLGS